jgi:uncharacterized membrane protein
MSDQDSILLTIAAMAVVTAACRCGGYFLLSRIPPSPFIRDALSYLPGCIFAAYVFPALLRGPPGHWAAAAATLAAMAASRNLGVSIAMGVATAWGINNILGG